MRKVLPEKLEAGRVLDGEFASKPEWHAYGCFHVFGPCGEELKIIASGGALDDPGETAGWEHVSVSTRRRCPNWIEMSFVKDLFWEDEECVVQYHPPKSDYVNNRPNVLHMWRHKTKEFPRPPSAMVGVAAMGEITPQQARVMWNAKRGRP
jgi:hypothetical protein